MSNAAGRTHPHRTYAQEFKQQVIRETLEPGMSLSIVARRHDINANVVFGWRKQYREGKLVVPALEAAPSVPSTKLLSVDVIDSALVLRPPESAMTSQATSGVPMPTPVCEIEVEIGKRRVRIRGLSAERAEAFLQECLK
ncbi:IS66-like element accessory protein TnpA [Paraburkholderia strydomiana]|uniref:IS66-like element accessory protein TnpA n=1 Tax=Paraburkholderia strydomiana TaxID=1245417 RepID=UPI001BE846FE|nr:transposase [Paraburkholderia strydomiana]MBT2791104.1 transposase [Paraburkholderia strydomiana]